MDMAHFDKTSWPFWNGTLPQNQNFLLKTLTDGICYITRVQLPFHQKFDTILNMTIRMTISNLDHLK